MFSGQACRLGRAGGGGGGGEGLGCWRSKHLSSLQEDCQADDHHGNEELLRGSRRPSHDLRARETAKSATSRLCHVRAKPLQGPTPSASAKG